MASNYKIGDLIRSVDVRNRNGDCLNLRGLSMTKEFRSSTSNIVGTDLTKYKIVKQGQFACDFMSTIRVHRFPVALNRGVEKIVVSPAYAVFEIKDSSLILAEYLMLWLSRSEFDRYADFRCDAAIRGGYGWNELCETPISLPPICEQKRIVNDYRAITNRISLKKKINNNLEATALAIYKSYFVNYDLFGGKMPKEWMYSSLGESNSCILGGTPDRKKSEYWNGDIAWINSGEVNKLRIIKPTEYITPIGLRKSATKMLPRKTVVVAITGATLGQISMLEIESCANQSVVGIVPNDALPYEYLYPYMYANIDTLMTYQTGGAQPHVNKNNIESLPVLIPDRKTLMNYCGEVRPMYETIANNCLEIDRLNILKDTLLGIIAR